MPICILSLVSVMLTGLVRLVVFIPGSSAAITGESMVSLNSVALMSSGTARGKRTGVL